MVVLLLTLLMAGQASAGKLTLSNKSNVPAQYTTWIDAYEAAIPGDTIYIMPSPTNYGALSLYKPLTLIGPGHRSINEQVATERVVTNDINLYAGSSGTSVIGLETGHIYTFSTQVVDDILIKNCRVRGHIEMAHSTTNRNWVIDGNIMTGTNQHIYTSGTSIILGGYIANNVFLNNTFIHSIYNSNVLVTNNVFVGIWAGATTEAINASTNLSISNNIFIGRHADPTNVRNCTFTNNLWYAENQTDIEVVDNFYLNNTVNTQPLFVNYDASTHNGNYNFNETYAFDFTLQAGSPGEAAGTDGANLGVGPNFSITGTSSNPQITYFQALSTMVLGDGTIDVKIKAVSGSN